VPLPLRDAEMPVDVHLTITVSCDHCLGLLSTRPRPDWPYGMDAENGG
jgi:hypothetical protein